MGRKAGINGIERVSSEASHLEDEEVMFKFSLSFMVEYGETVKGNQAVP
jgi:hypothetical protein